MNKTKETVETEEEKETSKQIKQLIKLKYFKEAYRLTLKYPNNAVIQSQKVTIYTEEGKYKKAKKVIYYLEKVCKFLLFIKSNKVMIQSF